MRLRVWLEDEPLSPDMDATMYLDVDMRGEWTLPDARALVLEFMRQAHDVLTPKTVLEMGPQVTDEQARAIREKFVEQRRKESRQ